MSVFKFQATASSSTPIPKRMRNKSHKESNSPTFAFSTSPSLLQDITLDKTELGSRNSASAGLTMKEYEEQLKKLTAENFNLKLRVYFVEERLSKVNGISDKEDLIKKNIQLKVTCESQSKELEKKQELLYDASKAFDLLQREHKEEIEKLIKEKEKEKADLENKVSGLEVAVQDLKTRLPNSDSFQDAEDFKTIELYEKQILELESHLQEKEEKNRELEAAVRDNHMDMESYHLKAETLETELEQRSKRIEELVGELERKEHDIAASNFRIRKLEDERNVTLRDEEIMKERLEEKNKTIDALKSSLSAKDTSIATLESRLAKERSGLQSLQSKIDTLNFQNIRLKEEIEMLQCRLRRGADISPRSKSNRCLDDEIFKQKYEELTRSFEERNIEYGKQIRDLEDKIAQRESENAEFQQLYVKHKKLEDDHRKACVALKNFIKRSSEDKKERETLNELLKSHEDVIKELKAQLERFTNPGCEKDSQDDKLSLAETGDNSEVCASAGDKDSCCYEKEKQIKTILSSLEKKESLLQEYEKKILTCHCGVEEKVQRICELEAEVVVLKFQMDDKTNEDMDPFKEYLTNELENKKCEIEKLNGDLKKRTYNLQELVNKELWDKNRQIEKLEKRLNSIIENNELEVMSLNQQISARDQQLKILQEKVGELGITANMPLSLMQGGLTRTPELDRTDELENLSGEDVVGLKALLKKSSDEKKYLYRKVDELKERLRNTPERDCGSRTVWNLKAECVRAKEQAEKAEIFRREAAEVCGLLTVRLEELAGFLDSLLTNRDSLSGVSQKRRQAIKQAVDQSRELSRHLSLSFANRPSEDSSLPWNSEEESCGDGLNEKFKSLLAESPKSSPELAKESISRSRDKVISEQSAMISRLREQLKVLNQQIKQRDIELSHCQTEKSKLCDTNRTDILDLDTQYDITFNVSNKSEAEVCNASSDGSGVKRRPETVEISRFEKSCQKILVVPDGKWKNTAVPQGSHEASESESWSEPDRNVSLARMGRIEDTAVSVSVRSLKCDSESSEETLNENSRNSVKRTRSTESEIRRLQSRVKLLDEINENLRTELNSLKVNRFDGPYLSKVQLNDDLNLAEKLRKTMEKLEESRFSCRQLEEKLSDALERASASAMQLTKAMESIVSMEDQIHRLKEELNLKKIESNERMEKICELENKMEEMSLENELRIIEAIKQKEAAERKALEVECRLKDAENMSKDVETRVMEIEKKIYETKQFKKETVLQFKEAEKHVDTAEKIMEEAEKMKVDAERTKLEAERKSKDVQSFVDLMRKEVEEKIKESERKVKRAEKDKEEADKQILKMKKRLLEAEKNKSEVEMKVKEGKETIHCMEEKLKELEVAMDQCNEEAQRRIKEIQKKADARIMELEHEIGEKEWVRKAEAEKKMMEAEKISRELEIGFRRQLDEADKKVIKARENAEIAIKRVQENFKKQETELRQKLLEIEKEKTETCTDMRRQLDEIRVEASEYELELTRLTNDKIHLEEELKRMLDRESALVKDHKEIKGKYEKSIQDLENKLSQLTTNKSELASRLEEIESTNIDLVSRISAIQGKESTIVEQEITSALSPPSSPVVPQGSLLCSLLTDMELCLPEINGNRHFLRQCSAASDPGEQVVLGVQSIEAFAPPRRNLNSSPDLGIESDPGRFSSLEAQHQLSGDQCLSTLGHNEESDIKKLEYENAELRRRLVKTRQALEETLTQLSAANQRKKQVERAICKQLHKTHHILKKARVNFEGADVDSVE